MQRIIAPRIRHIIVECEPHAQLRSGRAPEGANPLLLHDEPVFRDKQFIGRTTSGDLGHRTGLSLCFAMLKRQPGETLKDLRSGSFEISVAGTRHPLTPLARAPYDPEGARMRA